MKKFLLAACLFTVVQANAQVKKPSDAAMNRFVSDLMKKMTLDEKIGQLNLPGAGDIVTGQASNSDIAKRSKMDGWAVCSILSRSPKSKMYKSGGGAIALKDPLAVRHGCHPRLPNGIPHSPGHELYLGYVAH